MGLKFSGRRALLAAALLSGGTALAPATSQAEVPPPNKCWWTTGELRWTDVGLTGRDLWTAAAAASSWSSAPGSKIKLTYETEAESATTFANIKVAVLDLQGWPYYLPQGVHGFTDYGQDPITGVGGNCDANRHYTRQVRVLLDTQSVASFDAYMEQYTMSHEFGHAIGLAHTTATFGYCPNYGPPEPVSIMYYQGPMSTPGHPCGPDLPTPDDLGAANALYQPSCPIPCSC